MNGPALAGAADGIQRMRDGVRDWVRQPAHRAGDGDGADSPAILLSRLSASAFGPLLVTGQGAGADGPVLVPGGGQLLSQILTGARGRLGRDGTADAPPPEGPEQAIAARIQRVLAAGNARAKTLRNQIASALKEIDAGGTAVRAALDEEDEQARTGAIAALGAIGAGFPELAFLIDDAGQAAAEIQRRLDSEGAHARAVIGRNQKQSADIRLMREELSARPGQAGAGEPAVERGGQAGARVLGCPYRGLLPFEEANAGLFYGRERLAAELAAELATRVSQGGPVIVTGVSGAGKSSLLQAGLLPILARGRQVPGSGQWPRIAMTPTTDPLAELATRLAALGGDDVLPVRDRLARHPEQAHQAVWQAVLAAAARRGEQGPAASDSARLVLIVDQFEQVFTLNTGPAGQAARRAFVTALCAAATSRAGPRHEPPALVVIAVRADFWDRCAAFPGLAAALQDGQFIVGQMTEPEFRAAITGPAASAELSVDPALTGTIIGDLSALGGDDAAGALPLLSQALALTWENREGDRLTGHGYSQAGGISHAVQTGADDIYHALSPGQQALTRQLLANMTVAAGGRLACRPVSRKELYAGLPSAAPSQIDAVLTAFAAGRLVALHGDWAKISHDTLLRAWPRLRGWLAEDQASWVTYGQLADAAAVWHSSGDDPSLLYRGAHLAAVQQAATGWAQEPARSPAITGIQRDFLHTSERAARRTGRRRRGAVALLAVLALAVSAAFVVVFQQRNAALQQRDQAIYNQTIAEAVKFGASDTPLAAQLDLAAYRLHPTRGLASRLLDAENTPLSSPLVAGTRGVGSVAFSAARHMLASGNIDGTIRLWDVADPARPRLLGQPLKVGEAVESVAFSPDGRTLASSTYFGTVVLWDISDPAHPVALGLPLMAGSGIVYSVAFSPDGRTLATGDIDGTIQLWDVAVPASPSPIGPPLTAGASIVYSVAFSPDGRTLASGGSDGLVRLWDVAIPAHPRLLGQPQATGAVVFAVAFSPGGHTLASGGGGATVQLWDVASRAHPRPLGRPLAADSVVYSVAFSADGHTLASGGGDGLIRLWDAADPAHPRHFGPALTDGTNAVLALAFSPDGQTLASGNGDGTVRLWSIPATVLPGGTGGVGSVAFSADGHLLASGGGDGLVRLWDAADPAHPVPLGRPLAAGTGAADAVAFSPGGRILVTGSGDAMVRLWDVADPAHPMLLGSPLSAGASIVYAVAFSPDGRTLATAGDDGMVRLWDVARPAQPRLLGQPLALGIAVADTLAFSPTGRTLAAGTFEGTVRLWDVAHTAHPRRLGSLPAGASAIDSVAFSPEGQTLASGNSGGTVRLWDVAEPAHPRPIGQPLAGGTGAIFSVAFSHDGQTLASGSYDGAARLWNLDVGYAIEHICATAGGLTPQQWHQYIPLSPYQPSCPR